MTKTKTSTNNLVTKTEFRKGMKSTVKTLRGEMRETTKTLRGEMRDMEVRLLGEISRSETSIRNDMGEMKKELKDQFFTGWDKLLKEIQTTREEQAAHFFAHDRTDERLAKLEKRCPPNSS